jgi:hypothetical protein
LPLSRRAFLKTSLTTSLLAAGDAALPALASSFAAAPTLENPAATPPHPEFTRGLGIYPGDPADVFSPTLVLDTTTYRNLALRRPATHSSSYDYNLTAQLVTDGIIDTHLPSWVAVTSSTDGPLPKPDREIILDHFPPLGIALTGPNVSAEIHIAGGGAAAGTEAAPPEIDTLAVFVAMPDYVPASALTFSISTSADGHLWQQVATTTNPTALSPAGFPPDLVRGAHLYKPTLKLDNPSHSRFYKISLAIDPSATGAAFMKWMLGQVEFYAAGQRVEIGGPYDFTSAWMSAGSAEEWVAVDLGADCNFDRVALHWIARPAEARIQTSSDNHTWTDLETLNGRTGQLDDIHLAAPAHARHVRVLMTRPASPLGYILSELEVYGRGGPVAHPAPTPAPHADGSIDLAGGAWRVERASQIAAAGPALSQPGFADATWLVATVPGTVLTSFYNAGALPDPNFGQNQLYISDSYFCSDFWYRTEFDSPTTARNQIQWLNFDGINWKADIFLNGEKLSARGPSNAAGSADPTVPSISGGFLQARFDVSGKLAQGKRNALAVLIHKNATPGSTKQKTFEIPGRNGGALGADNPTYHASIGWDWIPTIRGRDTGIWGNVSLSTTGAVTLDAPFVSSKLPLPDTSTADLTLEVDLINHRPEKASGTLHFRFGDIEISHSVTVEPSSTTTVKLDSTSHPQLHHKQPQLWWPTGYGEPHLYDVELTFLSTANAVLDRTSFKHGIRNMTTSEDNGRLTIFINGRRFICRGGNWGFAESMLRYRAREYDAAVRYHREMNFTMIRNWVGQVGDMAFYEACDRHGVMIWQDFWLANPWDGPDPDNDAMFMANARDLLRRIRNHASIGLYCGRNEGFPPPPLESGLRSAIAELHPGLHYIPSSADNVVSGHGPYHALPPADYLRIADPKLHSEIGMPNIPPLESVRLMLPESALWPQGLEWGLHDFCLGGAMEGRSFRSIIDVSFGGASNAAEWIALAQFVNYEGYRAMFESQSKYRAGLLLWMSHSCWPSFVWQTYDYYFDPTSAYFGCKLASEPLHIQWNRDNESIEVVNYSAGNRTNLTATMELLNMDGARMATNTTNLDSKEDSTVVAFPMTYPAGLSPVHFLRLTLSEGSQAISANNYTRALQVSDFRAIRSLAKARVLATTTTTREAALWRLTTTVQNTSAWPALMTRLKAVRAPSGDRILPAIYSDNYITLMPNERRTLTTEFQHSDTRGEQPKMIVEGFNVQ